MLETGAIGSNNETFKMAFERYAGNESEQVGHHEEYFLNLASEQPEKYPELSKLYVAFYDSPVIND